MSSDPREIQALYNALRAGMQHESKFKLPYNKTTREKEIIQDIAEDYDIDTQKAKSKVITGRYDDGIQVFNYALEIAIAPRNDKGVKNAGEVDFIGNINDSPSIDGGEGYFSGGNYQWNDKKDTQLSGSSIWDILHECGFNTSDYTSKRRVPSVVYVNLKTPVPEWLGAAGKTRINLNPYANDIAKNISSLAKKMPTYHGKGYAATVRYNYSNKNPEQEAKGYLVDFLKKRRKSIQADPSLKTRDRITQSGVWYRIRPIMIEAGFEPRKDWGTTRRTTTGSIRDMCKELWPDENVTREDLGIIASARAEMLYDGQSYPVNIDSIRELAKQGIAIIVIEKEGIADLLAPYAEKFGVALVHTQGRFTEYGKDLIEEAKIGGSIVAILVDYDLYGVNIAKETRTKTLKIGIDRNTVKWLQQNGYPELTEQSVEEEYTPNISADVDDAEYLLTKRIELDSIAAQVGAEGFWKYVAYRLQLPEFSPDGFNLNKVIRMPENNKFYPDVVKELLSYLDAHIEILTKGNKKKLKLELEHIKRLSEIEKIEVEIEEKLSGIVTADKGKVMQVIIESFKHVMQNLPKLKFPTTKEIDKND